MQPHKGMQWLTIGSYCPKSGLFGEPVDYPELSGLKDPKNHLQIHPFGPIVEPPAPAHRPRPGGPGPRPPPALGRD